MTPCGKCGVEVLTARLSETVTRVFDAEPSPEGEWACWYAPAARGAPGGLWRARHEQAGDRFGDIDLRRLHACQPANQQLQLGA